MVILLPAQCHAVLLRKSVRGTPAYAALERASVLGHTIVPVDQIAVVCERQAAEELLKIAIDHCADAVPIIEEAIASGSR